MSKDIRCAIGIDIDAVAGWLGSYGGQDSPSDIQRGMFAGEVGVPRLLKFLDRAGIRASWFIPGHSLETFPDQTRMIVDAGHEIGAHGYSHENPIDMTPAQERRVLERCVELIEKVSGANWYLDDLPPMMFIKNSPNSHGFVSPRHIEEMWRDQFDWVYREMDYAVFALTIHPDVSGRPQVLLMLERLTEYITGHEGVTWQSMEEIAADFKARNPFSAAGG